MAFHCKRQIGFVERAVILSLAGIVSGCSLFNPHITSADLTRKYGTAKSQFEGDLPEVIDAVVDLQIKYLDAVGQNSWVSNSVGAALIPLSAVALYKGVTSDTARTKVMLAKAGATGAAGYMFANNFTSKPRQRAYLAGVDALSCSIYAMRPYLYTTAEFGQSKGAGRTTFLGALEALELSKLEVDSLLQEHTSAPGVKDAKRAVEAASVAIKNARQLRARVNAAGGDLRRAAILIQSRVSAEVMNTEPNISAIFSGLGGLRADAYRIGGSSLYAPATTAATAQSKRGEQKYTNAELKMQEDLLKKTLELQKDTLLLNGWLSDAEELRVAVGKSLADCNYAPAGNVLDIEPDVSELTSATNAVHRFHVSGGTGIPTASLVGSFEAGHFVANMTLDRGTYIVLLEAKGALGSDTAILVIADGTGRIKRSIAIKVEATGSGTPVGDKAKVPSQPANAFELAKIKADLGYAQKIQQGLGAPGDERSQDITDSTRTAIKKCQTDQKLALMDGFLNAETEKIVLHADRKCGASWPPKTTP